MRVEAALRNKRHRVVAVRMQDSAHCAARRLREENVGVLVVKDTCATEGDAVLGLLSERDILQAIVERGLNALKAPVSTLMSRSVVCCDLFESIDRALALMHRNGVRHLAVLHDGCLAGVVSMRDLVGLSLGQEAAAAPQLSAAE